MQALFFMRKGERYLGLHYARSMRLQFIKKTTRLFFGRKVSKKVLAARWDIECGLASSLYNIALCFAGCLAMAVAVDTVEDFLRELDMEPRIGNTIMSHLLKLSTISSKIAKF